MTTNNTKTNPNTTMATDDEKNKELPLSPFEEIVVARLSVNPKESVLKFFSYWYGEISEMIKETEEEYFNQLAEFNQELIFMISHLEKIKKVYQENYNALDDEQAHPLEDMLGISVLDELIKAFSENQCNTKKWLTEYSQNNKATNSSSVVLH